MKNEGHFPLNYRRDLGHLFMIKRMKDGEWNTLSVKVCCGQLGPARQYLPPGHGSRASKLVVPAWADWIRQSRFCHVTPTLPPTFVMRIALPFFCLSCMELFWLAENFVMADNFDYFFQSLLSCLLLGTICYFLSHQLPHETWPFLHTTFCFHSLKTIQ